MKKIAVINACSDLGVDIDGTDLGAELISENVKDNKYTVKKMQAVKDMDSENHLKNLYGVNEFNTRLYFKIKKLIESNFMPITIGGDHSVAIASSLASISRYQNLGIIWFDAHGDFNTFNTTISGNIHGMPLAAITNYEKRFLTNFHKRKLL